MYRRLLRQSFLRTSASTPGQAFSDKCGCYRSRRGRRFNGRSMVGEIVAYQSPAWDRDDAGRSFDSNQQDEPILCDADCNIKLAPGNYEIEAELEGYESATKSISVGAQGTNTVDILMVPSTPSQPVPPTTAAGTPVPGKTWAVGDSRVARWRSSAGGWDVEGQGHKSRSVLHECPSG